MVPLCPRSLQRISSRCSPRQTHFPQRPRKKSLAGHRSLTVLRTEERPAGEPFSCFETRDFARFVTPLSHASQGNRFTVIGIMKKRVLELMRGGLWGVLVARNSRPTTQSRPTTSRQRKLQPQERRTRFRFISGDSAKTVPAHHGPRRRCSLNTTTRRVPIRAVHVHSC